MDTLNQKEEKNKKSGAAFSFTVHIGLLILAIMPFLTFPDPPPGQEGIVVNLGTPDVGQGEENAPIASAEPEQSEEEPTQAEPEVVEEEVVEDVVEEEVKPEPVKEEVKPKKEEAKKKKIVKTEDPNAVRLRKEKEAKKKADAAKAKKRAEEEAKKRAAAKKKADAEAKKRAEAEAKRKAEAAAKAKAAADAKKYNDAKNKYGSLFGGGDGDGKGNTGKPGNQGDKDGDPNSDRLTGISTGSGKVGGGLGGRGLLGSPKLTDTSQKTGRVVLKVCVNSSGKVISAKYTQRGSTTNDARLRSIAQKNAMKWKFSKGAMEKQCGTITYDFKVK